MSSKFKKQRTPETSDSGRSTVDELGLSSADDGVAGVIVGEDVREASVLSYLRRHLAKIGIAAIVLVLGIGILARNGMLPNTDPISGKRTGWFGSTLPKNASSSWNPLAAPLPTATPQLSKENIFAGNRLLAVEDRNANVVPPTDLAVWRGSSGYWYVLGGANSAQTSYSYGQNGDTPVQGDYDGDGKTDFAVVRPTSGAFSWYILFSGGSSASFSFGLTSDKLVVADFDGDGKSDPAVFRPSTAYWYILRSSDSTMMSVQWGSANDVPAPADYDGDGKADFTAWHPGTNAYFYTLRSSDNQSQTVTYGTTADVMIPADYDGDGKADYAVFRPGSAAYFYIRQSSNNTTVSYQFGGPTDTPVQNDYDGDGKVDVAVWRFQDSSTGAGDNGNWYILQSGSGNSFRADHWGQTGDTPVPALYRR